MTRTLRLAVAATAALAGLVAAAPAAPAAAGGKCVDVYADVTDPPTGATVCTPDV
jgi:hypothetical protein